MPSPKLIPLGPSTELARHVVYMQKDGTRKKIEIWIGTPYQADYDGLVSWHCKWGIIGILDEARSYPGDTPFMALVNNLGSMKDHLKETTKGYELVDPHNEELFKLDPRIQKTPLISLKDLFGGI